MTYDHPYEGRHRDNTESGKARGERLDRAYYHFGADVRTPAHRNDSHSSHALNVIRGGGTRHHWRGVA